MNSTKLTNRQKEKADLLSVLVNCVTVTFSIMVFILSLSLPCHAADLYPACTTADLLSKISQANITAEPDTLHLPANCTYILSESVGLDVALFPITSEMTLQGAGANSTIIRRLTLTGAAEMRILYVDSKGKLTLDGVTLRAGLVSGDGGAILSVGSLTIQNSIIEHNQAFGDGGAIATLGPLTIQDSIITACNGVFSVSSALR